MNEFFDRKIQLPANQLKGGGADILAGRDHSHRAKKAPVLSGYCQIQNTTAKYKYKIHIQLRENQCEGAIYWQAETTPIQPKKLHRAEWIPCQRQRLVSRTDTSTITPQSTAYSKESLACPSLSKFANFSQNTKSLRHRITNQVKFLHG